MLVQLDAVEARRGRAVVSPPAEADDDFPGARSVWIKSLAMLLLLVAVVRAEPLEVTVTVDELVANDDGKFTWYHPRGCAIPAENAVAARPRALLTLQQHLQADDHYSGLYEMWQTEVGRWGEPRAIPQLAWQRDETGATVAVCDPTPGWHAASGRVLVIGSKILYDDAGRQLTERPHCHEPAYAVYTPAAEGGSWSPWRTIALPQEETFLLATPGCAQWVVEPEGDLLLPVYHKRLDAEAYSATVFRCRFVGDELVARERGTTLALDVVRGLAEPSLVNWQDRYYLTLRNDERGYWTASDDGLHFAPIVPWTFDDGQDLGSYNTQQHWLAHSAELFLVYTRRGANNDHVFRHRSPLFLAQFDPAGGHVVRSTEQVVIPDRGGEMGNFGVNPVSPEESWVTVGEYVHNDEARRRGAKGAVLVARVRWSQPNLRAEAAGDR